MFHPLYRLRKGDQFIHLPFINDSAFIIPGCFAGYSQLLIVNEFQDFAIGVHPVTMGDYLEFLNELARGEGLEGARGRSPRRVADQPGSTYLLEDGAGGLKACGVQGRWGTSTT